MTSMDKGASVPDQALAVPVEPASSLAPSGFDPSRWNLLADECAKEPDEFSDDYWDRLAQHPAVKPLGKRCHDCAVFEGMYAPATFSLSKRSEEVQQAVSAGWFCHTHPTRGCAGNIEFLTFIRDRDTHWMAETGTGSVRSMGSPGRESASPASSPIRSAMEGE